MLNEMKTTEFLKVLSSSEPVPGGGGASATVGAFSCALGMMVANLTIGKKRYADVEDEVKKICGQLDTLMNNLIFLTNEDARVFRPLAEAYGLPKNTEEEKLHREKVMEEALYEASVVPLKIMETVFEAIKLLEFLGEKGSRIAISDIGVAVLFGEAALEGASLNIFINTKLMKNTERADSLNNKAEFLISEGRKLKEVIYSNVLMNIK